MLRSIRRASRRQPKFHINRKRVNLFFFLDVHVRNSGTFFFCAYVTYTMKGLKFIY